MFQGTFPHNSGEHFQMFPRNTQSCTTHRTSAADLQNDGFSVHWFAISGNTETMRAVEARKIPIPLFLQRSGIKPARRSQNGRQLWYNSPLRAGDAGPSFKVDTVLNLRYDHGLARGGNVIDLVVDLRKVSVKEALAILAS